MSKKNIIKLNEQYFSCKKIKENFEDIPEKTYLDTDELDPSIRDAYKNKDYYNEDSSTSIKPRIVSYNPQKPKVGGICTSNPAYWDDKTRIKCMTDKIKPKVGGICTSNPAYWDDETRIKCMADKINKNSNKKPKKNSKKKSSKKKKEGFCAGNTCLTENNLKSLIKLLKKLELKK
jgi:hypothetical protein